MSKKPTLDELETVVRDLVIPFYRVDRDMYIPKEGKSPRRTENDAEHCWSLALLACSLAPKVDPSLDVGKVAQFALVHDLPEVFAGDVSTWDSAEKLAQKAHREGEAIEELAKRFPDFPWMHETIEAYEQRDTDEAKFVYAVDKLIALLVRKVDKGQAYIDKGLTREAFLKGLGPSRVKAQVHPEVSKYYEELWKIFEDTPEYFYRKD